MLELSYRHGLDGADLVDALGVSPSNANTIVHRLRETVERALGALLVSRGVRTDPDRCAELAAILDGWDGQFTVLMRKRIARHIEGCANCEEELRRLVNPVALLGAAPVFIPAPDWLRERALGEIELDSSATPLGNDHDADTRSRHSSMMPAVLSIAALLAALGLTVVWLQQKDTTAVTPVEISEKVSTPPVAPIKSNPPPPPQPPPTARQKPLPSASPPPPRQTPAAATPPQWPEWPFPEWPPPGGGSLTGPPIIVDPPRPPSSRP